MGQKRAAVYCRISDDRSGKEAGVQRQREDCLALVAREGWSLVHDGPTDTFTDNDVSAFSGKKRPAYRRLVEAVTAGEVDYIVTWHNDRLHRRPVELEALIALVERTKVKVATVKAGEFDLSTRQGITMARLGVTIANDASMATRERVQRAMRERAEQGKVHGALRTYGYAGRRNDDGTHTIEVVPEEAAVIREAARRVMAGEALLSVVKDFNARGISSLRGGQWSRSTLRGVLVSARVAGWREHTEGRTNGAHGSLWRGGEFVAKAEWKGILTRQQVEQLRRALTDPARARKASGRTYLLSGGLVVCGMCGTPLRGRPTRNGLRDYTCTAPPVGRGCGSVSIKQDALDTYVRDLVRAAIADGRVAERLRAGSGDADEAVALVSSLETDLAALAEDHGAGRITRPEWMAAREPLTARLDAARRDLARRDGAESLALVSGGLDAWDRRWHEAGRSGLVDRQRAMLRAVMASVAVGPAVRGRNRFDPDRVSEPDWRA
ncbi:Site-specific DNA recombinase [Pedococcus dokdonensis]|uniref:Site-specific DNA recombinase n=2 Tax=Pedococcus dokdonensis TaxID=443156 RepID=A0A1H0N3H3_9MICO|nr:recombinase family protein [Pedococcus dokdonensis]SDO87274.1 Site-specific DNA recombinase [Pedococcus dokdonensis]